MGESGDVAVVHQLGDYSADGLRQPNQQPALYVVQEDDPLAAAPEIQRKVFAQMGLNADFKVIAAGDENLGRTMARAVAVQIEWLKAVFARV